MFSYACKSKPLATFPFPSKNPVHSLADSCGLSHPLAGFLCPPPLLCLTTQSSALQGPSVLNQAPLFFLPHSFTFVNFLSSLCLFMAHIPSRSYFHRLMRCVPLAKAAGCVGIQFSSPLPLPGSLLSPPVSTCSKVTARSCDSTRRAKATKGKVLNIELFQCKTKQNPKLSNR